MGFGLREGVRGSGFFFGLDAIRKQSNFIIEYFNKSYLKGRKDRYSGAKTIVGREGTVTHISDREMTNHFHGVGEVCVFN